jgi:p-aminobenzoyl-glutamate transporter AbgT
MLRPLINGFIGASVLTVAHQILKSQTPDAPRLDKLGMEGAAKVIDKFNLPVPKDKLYIVSMLSDLAMNTMYYSQVGNKRGFGTLSKGMTLGLTMGGGVTALPGLLGLDGDLSSKNKKTTLMTMGLYALGGLAAAAAAQVGGKKK